MKHYFFIIVSIIIISFSVNVYGEESTCPSGCSISIWWSAMRWEPEDETLIINNEEVQSVFSNINNPTEYAINNIKENIKKSKKDDNESPTLGQDQRYKQIVHNGFSFNNQNTNVQTFHTPFPLITTQVGQQNTIQLKIFEDKGINNIRTAQIGLGVLEIGSPLSTAEAQIELLFKHAQLNGIQIIDPNNIIENDSIKIDVQEISCDSTDTRICLKVEINYINRESPRYNVMMITLEDFQKNSANFYLNDGIEVIGESLNEEKTIMILASMGGRIYPQDRGLVELKLVDKKNNQWIDPFNYLWQKSNDRFKLISEIIPEKKQDDYTLKELNRNHPGFVIYMKEQTKLAENVINEYHRLGNIHNFVD